MKSTLTALLAICLCWALGCGGEKTLKQRAEAGDAEAQVHLGSAYYAGKGVPQDLQEAANWFRKAAEQGNADAQYNLGVMYHKGEGVLEDDKEAVKWYRKAAEQGDADAQNNLGVMYGFGKGVPQDYVTAYAWYNIAQANGNAKAKEWKGIVAKKMTPDQIAEGQKLSREMLKKNPKLLGE